VQQAEQQEAFKEVQLSLVYTQWVKGIDIELA